MAKIRLTGTLVFAALLFLGAGCGDSTFQPSGKILKGGAPLKLSEKAVLQIALYKDDDKAFADPVTVNWLSDGTFKVVGIQSKGIKAGKYKASIKLIDPYPGEDVLGGKFSEANCPVVEIKDAHTEIIINLDKK